MCIRDRFHSELPTPHGYARDLGRNFDRTHDYAFDLTFRLTRRFTNSINTIVQQANQLGYAKLVTELSTLQIPNHDAPATKWRAVRSELEKVIDSFEHDFKDPYKVMSVNKSEIAPRIRSDEQRARINKYWEANRLLVECMKIARLPKATRLAIENRMLMPPVER